MDATFHPARLLSRAEVGGGLTLVRIEAADATVASYVSPGQYVEVRAGGATGYFVVASEPQTRPLELIMRAGGGVSDVLLAAPAGTGIEVTAAIGDGFPMAAARGAPLIVALSGTGIAAARPLVRRRVADGDAARTQVFLGVRARGELAIAHDLDKWADAGIRLVVCLSQPDADRAGDTFVRGYVQDVLRARAESNLLGPMKGGSVFAVGVASMVDALRDLAPALGVPPARVYTNH